MKEIENSYTFMHSSAYEGQPAIHVTVTTDASSLDEIIEEFAMFLKGCGFSSELVDETLKAE